MESIAFTNGSALRMTTTKSYDYLNRLTAIQSSGTGFQPVSFAYGYNNANQRTTVTNADASRWNYGYDPLGQVTSGKKYWSDNTLVAGEQFEYMFDDIGNRKTTAAGGDTSGANLRSATYSPNLLNQPTSRTVPTFVNVIGEATNAATVTVNNQATARHGDYFRAELRVTNTTPVWFGVTNLAVLNQGTNADIIATNAGNVFVAQTPEAYGYDADGNMTNDGRFMLTWDAENRLVKVESLTNAPAGSKRKVEWTFDALGRRIRQTESIWNPSTNGYQLSTDTKFVSDGWWHIAELDTTNLTLRTYAWGLDLSGSLGGAGGVGGLLLIHDQSTINNQPSTHITAYDGNGNVSALVSMNDGTETARYEYGPFGELLRATGLMAFENPFRFSTKRTSDATDWVLYEYRVYNPGTGRWLSRDPIYEKGGLNIYSACGNDLLAKNDFLGLSDQFVGPKCPCGPDVTDVLKKALEEVGNKFGALEEKDQRRACQQLTDITTGAAAWDFDELYNVGKGAAGKEWTPPGWPGPAGFGQKCKRTVTFNGKCYYAGSVNYALWGKACSLCYEAAVKNNWKEPLGIMPESQEYLISSATVKVLRWKAIRYLDLSDKVDQAIAFTKYGYGHLLVVQSLECNPGTDRPVTRPLTWYWKDWKPKP